MLKDILNDIVGSVFGPKDTDPKANQANASATEGQATDKSGLNLDTFDGIKESFNDLLKKINDQGIFDKIKEASGTVGMEATRIALQLYYVMKSPETPTKDKLIIGAALAYQFMPNLLSTKNFGPIVGMLDNVLALGVAYRQMKQLVTPEIEAEVNKQVEEWFKGKPTEPQTPAVTPNDPA